MTVISTCTYTEVHVELAEGEYKDFLPQHLVPDRLLGGELMMLPSETLREIAHILGFDACTWSGHYHEECRTVDAVFRKRIGDASNQIDYDAYAQNVYQCSITAKGIRFRGKRYQNPYMLHHLHEKVFVTPISDTTIRVSTSNEVLIFEACPHLR